MNTTDKISELTELISFSNGKEQIGKTQTANINKGYYAEYIRMEDKGHESII